ncbi:PLP-dependent transferase, partial [Hyphococcus sp.]|uniref:PLP-dependent transferase n=1 Tax=Hyphococcus sp. TaxID=2038636 RepID=UPI003751B4C1
AVFKPMPLPALKAFFNAFKLFGMGFSWGGYESLALHVKPETYRSATQWKDAGPVVRFHAGLEDIEDLKIDLERAFMSMNMTVPACGAGAQK